MPRFTPEGSRPNDAPWIQEEVDAGRDVDTTGHILLCRTTLNFSKGSGCLVGSGVVRSIAHPILHATADYERAEELLAHIVEGGDFIGDPRGRSTEATFLADPFPDVNAYDRYWDECERLKTTPLGFDDWVNAQRKALS